MKEAKKILRCILDKLLTNIPNPDKKVLEKEFKEITDIKLLRIVHDIIRSLEDIKPEEVKEQSESETEITECVIFSSDKLSSSTLKILSAYIDIIKDSKKSLK